MPGKSGSRDPRYDSARWRALRKTIRKRDPRCKGPCNGFHSTRYVDHVKPAKGNDALFWDEDNLQGLCDGCHRLKSRREQAARGELAGGGEVRQRQPLVKGVDAATGVPVDPQHHWNQG